MTDQELFDKVWLHAKTQNAPAREHGSCRYRMSDGKMCFIGCLIPDAAYRPEFESYALHDAENLPPIVKKIMLAAGISSSQIGLARRLQEIHDEIHLWEWPTAFADVATDFGLVFTP